MTFGSALGETAARCYPGYMRIFVCVEVSGYAVERRPRGATPAGSFTVWVTVAWECRWSECRMSPSVDGAMLV